MKPRLVGGTEAGDAPAPDIWDDPNGVDRCLRRAMGRDDIIAVCLVMCTTDGKVITASNFEDLEPAIGLVERGKHFLCGVADLVADEASETTES